MKICLTEAEKLHAEESTTKKQAELSSHIVDVNAFQ
jgi:hypothetical protein